jgi:zinc transporter ZupT
MKKNSKKIFLINVLFATALILPIMAFAQSTSGSYASASCPLSGMNTQTFGEVLSYITCLIGTAVIPLIFGLAVAMFVYGVVQYVINATNEEKRQKGKQLMIWGILALTVMISVWGLVHIAGNTFHLPTNVLPQVRPS